MLGAYSIGSHGLPETLLRDPPSVTLTGPTGTITTTTTTVTWTYSSLISRPQLWYRVRLLTDSGALLYDSMNVVSIDDEQLIPFPLAGFASYLVEVTVSDGLDTSKVSGVFYVETADLEDLEVESRVGSVFEVAINGVGFMLADHPDKEPRYGQQVSTLEAPRFATSSTPFTEAIDRYTFLGHDDWSGGAGQRWRNLADSDPGKFWDSENIDPFTEPGTISLVDQVLQESSLAYAAPKAVVANGVVYIASSTTQLTAIATPGGAETAFTAAGAAGTGTWLASDGANWYWSNGANIRRNSSAADPGSDWSTVDVTEIAWCSDRLVGIDSAAGTPNVTTFDPAGAEEVAGGRFLFPGAVPRGLCGGDGYLWFGVNRGTTSEIRAWQLGSVDEDFVALNLPAGEAVDSLFFYLGNVFVSTHVEGKTRLYRCVPQQGNLTPEQFLTQDASHDVTWTGYDRFVAFTWKSLSSTSSGIGVLDLATGGYAKWYQNGDLATPFAVVRWAGFFGFTAATVGFWSPAADPAPAPSGFLVSSTEDLASGLAKIWDGVSLTASPLTLGNSIQVLWAANQSTFHDVGTFVSGGGTSAEFSVGKQSRSITLKIVMATSAETSPQLKNAQVQLHPLTPVDQQLSLPLLLADESKGLNGTPLPSNQSGRSLQLLALVKSWVGQRVQVQDIDWPVSAQTFLFEAVAVQVVSMSGVFDNSKGRRSDEFVAVLTLRRGL